MKLPILLHREKNEPGYSPGEEAVRDRFFTQTDTSNFGAEIEHDSLSLKENYW